MQRWLAIGSCCTLLACAPTGTGTPDGIGDLPPGDHTFMLRHAGRTRAYIAHVPASVTGAAPVVIAFHGGGGEAHGFKAYAGLDPIADREGFVAIYPYGSGLLPRRLLTWNAGHCCGWAMNQSIDDVDFTIAVLDDLAGRAAVDGRRVYATGHSNGAMMAYRLAAERPDRVAAIAPVAGGMNLDMFSPELPVPVLHIHSVDDPRALYGGGLGPPFPGTNIRSAHRPVEQGLERWRERNGCAGDPREEASRTGGAGTPNEGQTATLLVWSACSTGATVALWKLSGVGHGWPGIERETLRVELIGPSTTLVDAAEEAWRFFDGKTR